MDRAMITVIITLILAPYLLAVAAFWMTVWEEMR